MGLFESINAAIRTSVENPSSPAPSGPASGATSGGGGLFGGLPSGLSGGVASGLPPAPTGPETGPAAPINPLSTLMHSGIDALTGGGERFMQTVAGDGPSLPSPGEVGSKVVDAYGDAAKNVAGLFDGLF